MKTTLLITAFFAATLVCCSARPEAAPAPSLPIFPFWNKSQLPDGPPAGVGRLMPMPAASAVLVAPGWLVTSEETMGEVAMDLLMDPTVYVFDGTVWHVGRYVDYDRGTRLALISADVPGTAATLTTRSGGALHLAAIPWAKALDKPIVRQDVQLQACDTLPDWMVEVGISVVTPTYCFRGKVMTLAGGALVDADGRLAGLQVSATAASDHAGASADDIRAFVRTYFASWGRDVKEKPRL